MSKINSKQKVLHAALSLFYQKGFHATSVRDIAKKAGVNISLISYYFNSKQGLFEHAVINYYEDYLSELQTTINANSRVAPIDQLKKLIVSIIQYKHLNQKLSCFIHRELSVDSTFMREIYLTYIAKENYYIKEIFTEVLKDVRVNQITKEFMFMQLKGMLASPYTLQKEFQQTLLHPTNNAYFVKNYTETIFSWLEMMTKIE